MAVTRPFVFGTFNVFEGRSAYTLQSAQPVCYFDELSADMEGACYGAYFLEMASYVAQENMDGTELLTLVYQTLKALLNPSLPNRLIRRIFELKAMVINGEYTENPRERYPSPCSLRLAICHLFPCRKPLYLRTKTRSPGRIRAPGRKRQNHPSSATTSVLWKFWN